MSNNKHKKLELSLEKGDLLPVLLILPTLLIVLVVMIMPLCYGVFISLFDYDIGNTIAGSDFIGAGNYIKMIKDPTFWKSLYNTVLFALGATAGDIIIGTVISVLLLRLRPRLQDYAGILHNAPACFADNRRPYMEVHVRSRVRFPVLDT